jgi:Xaa-Pro aminopeptidase
MIVDANKILSNIKKQKLESLLVTSGQSISYLTGLRIDYGCVILTKKDMYLLTDSRYSEMAENRSSGRYNVITARDSLVKTVGLFLVQNKIKNIGIESEKLRLSFYNNLKKAAAEVRIVEAGNIIGFERMIKKAHEIKNIKKAVKITDLAFSFIFKYIKNNFKKNLTEQKIAWELEKFIRENGGDGISFKMIIASGHNSSVPHYQTGSRIIQKGDMIILDFGVLVNGYCSDLTRTIFIGKPDERQKKIYETVLKTQKAVIKKVKTGITGQALDLYVRKEFASSGYGDNFLHGLGHGVGLEIHELPYLNKYHQDNMIKLKENMIFTIEPGLYFAGWGGVRIEDVVCVTKNGCEVLSKSPKEIEEMIIRI